MNLETIKNSIAAKNSEIINIEEQLKIIEDKSDRHKSPRKLLIISILVSLLSILFPFLIIFAIVCLIVGLKKDRKSIREKKKIDKSIELLLYEKSQINHIIRELNQKKYSLIESTRFRTFVTGTSYRQKEIKKIVMNLIKNKNIGINDDYQLTKNELIECGMYGYKIWEYDQIELELIILPEKDNEFDKNALAIHARDEDLNLVKLGYIPKKDINRVNSLDIDKVIGIIKGGKYKMLDLVDYNSLDDSSEYELLKNETNYSIDLVIMLNKDI